MEVQLNLLSENNQEFLTSADWDNPTLIINVNASIDANTLESLAGLNQNNLNELREGGERSQRGFQNNMIVLQDSISKEIVSLRQAIGKEMEKKAVKESNAFQKSRRESRIRGGGHF